jgi:CheY-like chemotaxis protein
LSPGGRAAGGHDGASPGAPAVLRARADAAAARRTPAPPAPASLRRQPHRERTGCHDSAIELRDRGRRRGRRRHHGHGARAPARADVMVLDLNMPGLGGAGVLERLGTELPHIRALVMSADESPESVVHTVGAGAVGYLSKGEGLELLVARALRWPRRSTRRRARRCRRSRSTSRRRRRRRRGGSHGSPAPCSGAGRGSRRPS